MGRIKCPGQNTQFWQPEDIFETACVKCGQSVEFFKDDANRRCPSCGARITNPKLSLGCAQWCEYAEECLGFDPKTLQPDSEENVSLADRLIDKIREYFGTDQKRIEHALLVFSHAQEILRKEDGDPRVVIAAALLHDIGIVEAERKHGSSAGRYQEIEGPPIARGIMADLGLDAETIDHVSRIIANHHSARDIDTPEFRIIWDADWLANFPQEFPDADADRRREMIDKLFKTTAGREKALRSLVPQESENEAAREDTRQA